MIKFRLSPGLATSVLIPRAISLEPSPLTGLLKMALHVSETPFSKDGPWHSSRSTLELTERRLEVLGPQSSLPEFRFTVQQDLRKLSTAFLLKTIYAREFFTCSQLDAQNCILHPITEKMHQYPLSNTLPTISLHMQLSPRATKHHPRLPSMVSHWDMSLWGCLQTEFQKQQGTFMLSTREKGSGSMGPWSHRIIQN